MRPLDVIALLTAEEVFGLTLVGEARGEPIEGIVAVASVIRNRFHSRIGKYASYREVCLEPDQFSCWNEKDSNYSFLIEIGEKLLNGSNPNDIYIRQCIWVAHGMINWDLTDNTGGRIHYLTTTKFKTNPPNWAKNPKGTVVEIGSQTFFNV